MSIGNLGNNLNKGGGDLYAKEKGRIMREAEAKKVQIEKAESDRANMEISRLRLHKQTLEGRILELGREIRTLKDQRMKTMKETELHRLQSERLHQEGEIMRLQGRIHGSHNVRFNNPHYF